MTSRKPPSGPSTSAAPFSLLLSSRPPVAAEEQPAEWGQYSSYQLLELLSSRPPRERRLASRRGQRCVIERVTSRDRDEVAQFIDEAGLAVTFDHANILHTFDVGSVDDDYYRAFSYTPGTTLAALLARLEAAGAAFPLIVTAHVLRELISALRYAHARLHPVKATPLSVVHGGIDADMLMIDLVGNVIVDGLERAMSTVRKTPWAPAARDLPPDDTLAPATSLDVLLVGRLGLRLMAASGDTVPHGIIDLYRAAIRAAPAERPELREMTLGIAEDGREPLAALLREHMPEVEQIERRRAAMTPAR